MISEYHMVKKADSADIGVGCGCLMITFCILILGLMFWLML